MYLHARGGAPGNGRGRRKAVLAGVAAAAVLALAACSSGGAGSGGADGSGQDVALTFSWWGDASRAERYEQALEIFEEENPGITVRTNYAGFADYWTARNTEAASRTLPDVLQMDLAYLTEYTEFGHVIPLDAYFGDTITVDTISEPLLASGQVDGQTYGLASSASTLGTFVNTDLLDELGVTVPKDGLTWDEYDALLAEISAAGAGHDPVVHGSVDYTQFFWLFQIWLQQNGKSLLDGDQLGFDEADLATWWDRSAAVHEQEGFLPAKRQEQLSGADAIGVGETAAEISWDNFLVRFSEGQAKPNLTLLPVPADDLENNSGMFLKPGLQLSVAANSEHPDEAAKLVDFLVNDPRVGEIFGMSRGVPASGATLEGVELTELDQQILDYEKQLEPHLVGSAPPPVAGLSNLETTFSTTALEVAYGTLTVDEAVDRWFAEAATALAG
ncbi:ABC transporter substrate-binding protein [Promicromonospora sp. NPDC060204]|uniref:ABC transporter substrate-binding protein n=1 Tax=Promicromonospora sp. NPDC060204 TaxID=3347071 RepID=UPI0036556D3F